MMNKVLLVYCNTRIYSLSLSVLRNLNINNFDIMLSCSYYNSDQQILENYNWIKQHTRQKIVTIKNIEEYNIIILPTPIKNDCLELIYKKNSKAKFIFIEEGASFYEKKYLDNLTDGQLKIFNTGECYLSRKNYYHNSHLIDMKQVEKITKNLFFQEIKNLPKKIKTIIFSEPKEHDQHDRKYHIKMNNLMNMESLPILLKRHPRDETVYKMGENIYECPKELPGQLLFSLYPQAKFILTGESSIQLYIPKEIKTYNYDM